MRAFPSLIQPSRNGHRAAATAVVLALVAGLAAGFSLFGATAPAAAATAPVGAGLTSVGPFTKTTASTMTAASGPIAIMAATPDPANPVWSEDFGTGNANAQQITTYKPGTYTADAYWNNGQYCNGVILAYNTTIAANTAACNTWAVNNVRSLAEILGRLAAGTTTASDTTRNNRAVVEWTQGGPTSGRGTRMLITSSDLGLPGDRYYLPQIDIAETSCGLSNSNITVGLQFGTFTVAQTATSSAVVTCTAGTQFTGTSPTSSETFTIRANTLRSTNALMLPAANASSLRLFVNNSNTNDGGNDVAIDTPRIVDVTPRLTQSLSTATMMAGDTATLTFTITNTSEAAAKTDMRFTNTLPAGLVIANPMNTGGTCNAVTGQGSALSYQATSGSNVLAVSGLDFASGATSCTMTVDVTAANPGTYTNTSDNFTNANLLLPADATLTVTEPARLTIRKNLTATRSNASDQFTLSVSGNGMTPVTATTTGASTGIQAAQVTNVAVRPGSTYTIAETVNSTASLSTYQSSYECRRSGTVIASGTTVSGELTIPNEPGAQIECTFTNTPQPARMYCASNYFYAIGSNGAVAQVASGSPTRVANAVTGISGSANALGVSADGSTAYAIDRNSNNAGTVDAIVKYAVNNGAVVGVRDTSAAQALSGAIIAGAVDPFSGRYVIASSAVVSGTGRVYLYEYDASATAGSKFIARGYISTGSVAAAENGDLSFDKEGNLHIVQTAMTGSNVRMYTVQYENFNAASSGAVIASSTVTRALPATSSLIAVNGMAFAPRGTVYLGNGDTAYQYDPSTWTRVAGTSATTFGTVFGTGITSTDLASCSSPSTLSVEKNVIGRSSSTDQFVLTATVDGQSQASATATTTGTATGVQAERVGPMAIQIGTVVTVAEAMAAGSSSTLASYNGRYECWADGIRISSGSVTSATITIPNKLSVGVDCTFFNTPVPAASVTITKYVQDAAGANQAVAAGWTVGMTATATTTAANRGATALPYNTPQQVTDEDGVASWTVLFGADAARARLDISEVQKSDYEFVSGRCVITPATGTANTVQLTGATGNAVNGVKAGDNVQCTIVNKVKETRITLINVVNGSRAVTDWTLTATGPSGSLAGPTGTSGVTGLVTPATAYALTQTGNVPRYVNNGYSCVDQSGTTVAVSSGSVTLPLGTRATCTITNSTSRITLLKNVVDSSTGFAAPQWTIVGTPVAGVSGLAAVSAVGAEYSAAGNTAQTFEVRPGHGYTLSERLTDTNSTLAYQQLRLERRNSNGTWSEVSTSITAPSVGTTEPAVYRFVNARVPALVLPLTGGTSSDTYVFVGAGILILATALVAFQLWRRRRGATA